MELEAKRSSKHDILDFMLWEVSKRYITIKDDVNKESKQVFQHVFNKIKEKMGDKCNFFKSYSCEVLYGGSVADGTKISKLDEFDMDIVIRLPINYNDGSNGIVIENDNPGYVKIKIENEFDNLDKQQHWELRHKVTRDWRDSEKYFLQNKFRHWMHSIVQKAINDMQDQVEVNGLTYKLKYKESGPAYTLQVMNDVNNEPFYLDVDIVPVIKFSNSRWPTGYKKVENVQAKNWLAVPKPNKCISDRNIGNRCWRLSFQDYETAMIKDCQNLKSSIKLVKKLRDAQKLKDIASYYIKTLFLWKISKNDKSYWQNKIGVIFRDMVQEFYDAVSNKNIPYFWQEENNLIENLKCSKKSLYESKLKTVLNDIDANNVEKVVTALLTEQENADFKQSEELKKITDKKMSVDSGVSLPEEIRQLRVDIESNRDQIINDKLNALEMKLNDLSDRIRKLEMGQEVMKLDVPRVNNLGPGEFITNLTHTLM